MDRFVALPKPTPYCTIIGPQSVHLRFQAGNFLDTWALIPGHVVDATPGFQFRDAVSRLRQLIL